MGGVRRNWGRRILGAAYLFVLYQRTMLAGDHGRTWDSRLLFPRDRRFRAVIVWAFWTASIPKPYFDILRKPVTENCGACETEILQRGQGRGRGARWPPCWSSGFRVVPGSKGNTVLGRRPWSLL